MRVSEAEGIKIAVLRFWCGKRLHYPVGAMEFHDADVMVIARSLAMVETEVKLTIADMRSELKSKWHKHWRMAENVRYLGLHPAANYFFFAVPEALKDRALAVIDELYPYAGLLIRTDAGDIERVKQSRRFSKPKPELKQLMEIGYAATQTILKYGYLLVLNRQGVML